MPQAISETELSQSKRQPLFYRTKHVPPLAVSGHGIYIDTADGRRFVDAFGGACVNSLGSGHPKIIEAVTAQMSKLAYAYQYTFTTQPAEDLAEYLIQNSNGYFERVNFVAGGNIIGRDMSFHGNTLGALSLGHHVTRRELYEGILNHESFHHVSACLPCHVKLPNESDDECSSRLAKELDDKIQQLGPETVMAFVAEPMVGAATGCTTSIPGYWPKIKEVCDRYGVLLIFDEIMCGMWRLGTQYAFESVCEGVVPHIMTCGKGLGAGYVSVGAMFIGSKVAKGIREGQGPYGNQWFHGHTYVGHPVTCAGALAVQKVIRDEKLDAMIPRLGGRVEAPSRTRLESPSSPARDIVLDIRGKGLFWGIEYQIPDETSLSPRFADRVATVCMDNGVVIMGASGVVDGIKGEVSMIAPAFICSLEDIDHIANVFCDAVETCATALQL